jgi:hypothetical protein
MVKKSYRDVGAPPTLVRSGISGKWSFDANEHATALTRCLLQATLVLSRRACFSTFSPSHEIRLRLHFDHDVLLPVGFNLRCNTITNKWGTFVQRFPQQFGELEDLQKPPYLVYKTSRRLASTLPDFSVDVL